MKEQITIINSNNQSKSNFFEDLYNRENCEVLKYNTLESSRDFLLTNNFKGEKWIIITLSRPLKKGLNLIRDIKLFDKEYRVCVLSDITSEHVIAQCFQYGICDYIIKNKTSDEIMNQLNHIIDNSIKATPQFIERYEVKEVINDYKIKKIKGRILTLDAKEELPINSLISLPDNKGDDHLYRVKKCYLNDNGTTIICHGLKNRISKAS